MSERANILIKKKNVETITTRLKNSPVVAIVNVQNLPGRSLHEMKRKLYGKAQINMAKKSTVARALQNANLGALEQHLKGQPALLLTKESPFKIYNFLAKNKSKTSAKMGDVLPADITVSPGITNVAPGPSIGLFKKFRLDTKVTQGKLEVTKEVIVARAGDTVNKEMLDLFTMLGIQPMKVGLDLVAAHENGTIYGKDVMSVSEEEYVEMIQKAYTSAFNLAFNAGIVMKENVETFIAKAVRSAKSVKAEAKLDSDNI